MHEYFRSIGKKAHRECVGMCCGSDVWSERFTKRRISSRLGEINLCRGHITTEIVSHELTHAAISWARRVKIDPLVTR